MSQAVSPELSMSLPNRLVRRVSARTGVKPVELTRFIKFALVGALGMVVDLSVLTFSKEALGLPLTLAVALGFSLAVISNFTWNRFWTFPESRERPIAGQLVQFTIINLIGLAINEVIVLGLHPLFSDALQDPYAYLAAKVIAIGVVLFWNYGANRVWTYKGIE